MTRSSLSLICGCVTLLGPPTLLAQEIAVTPGASLEIRHRNGRVRVVGWARDAITLENTGANAMLRTQGQTVVLSPSRSNRSLNVLLRVPHWLPIMIDGTALSVELADLKTDVRVETVSGSIVIRGVEGTISLATVSGNLTARKAVGTLTMRTVNGTITVDGLTGRLTAESTNGAIDVRAREVDMLDVSSVNGALRFGGAVTDHGRISMETYNGIITMRLPSTTGADVTVESSRGAFQSALPITLQPGSLRRSMRFTLGDGGARIRLKTLNGSITLQSQPDR